MDLIVVLAWCTGDDVHLFGHGNLNRDFLPKRPPITCYLLIAQQLQLICRVLSFFLTSDREETEERLT